jgi:RimJ/RimL family protein N-acetyltransferase
MVLTPFGKHQIDSLIQWIDSAELNELWSGGSFSFPLDPQQLSQHLSKPKVHAYLFSNKGSAIGYAELNQHIVQECKLCRVLISPQHQGKGLAKIMLSQLIELAVTEFNVKRLSLAVFAHNYGAIRCYTQLGFSEIPNQTQLHTFNNQCWQLLFMQKMLSSD